MLPLPRRPFQYPHELPEILLALPDRLPDLLQLLLQLIGFFTLSQSLIGRIRIEL